MKDKLKKKIKMKVSKSMKEYYAGKLKSGSGHPVTDRAQAAAIGYSEAGEKRKKS